MALKSHLVILVEITHNVLQILLLVHMNLYRIRLGDHQRQTDFTIHSRNQVYHCPPPYVVIEITSWNYKTDLVDKVDGYARREIPYYVIVNRCKSCVTVYSCPKSSKYSERESFFGDEVVNVEYLKIIEPTAGEMLEPPRTSEDVKESPERRARAAERRVRAAESKVRRALVENEEMARKVQRLERENAELQARIRKRPRSPDHDGNSHSLKHQ